MNRIYLTEKDYHRLHNMVQAQRSTNRPQVVETLGKELERAKIVSSLEIPPNVVTMNSRVRVMELKSNSEMTITIVYPQEADFNAGKITILSPLGTAILGSREGDEVIWTAPYCKFIYRIKEVLYQTEAAGLLT